MKYDIMKKQLTHEQKKAASKATKKWSDANPQKVKDKGKKWREANPEKVKIYAYRHRCKKIVEHNALIAERRKKDLCDWEIEFQSKNLEQSEWVLFVLCKQAGINYER